MRWFETLIPDLGEAGEDFVAGRHTSMVLKEVSVRYRAPMTYPDAVSLMALVDGFESSRAMCSCRVSDDRSLWQSSLTLLTRSARSSNLPMRDGASRTTSLQLLETLRAQCTTTTR